MMSTLDLISLMIGGGGLIIAFATIWISTHNNTKQEAQDAVNSQAKFRRDIDVLEATLKSSLDKIDDGVRDLKAEYRSMRTEMREMRKEIQEEVKAVSDQASHAVELAEAAHRRLDRMGADPDILSQ